jgi:hypothetical protein
MIEYCFKSKKEMKYSVATQYTLVLYSAKANNIQVLIKIGLPSYHTILNPQQYHSSTGIFSLNLCKF